VNIEAGIVYTASEKNTPFLYKTKIPAEGKIRQRIINQQQAKSSNWYPEQHAEKYVY
jgi:hypothetical protein